MTSDADEADEAERELSSYDGIRVETAGSVEEALRLVEAGGLDCVVSDHDLPDVSGVVLLQAVRVQYPDLPFLLYTAEGDEHLASRAISARVTDYLVKEEEEQWGRLASLVERAVDYRRTRDSVGRPEPVLDAMERRAEAERAKRRYDAVFEDPNTLTALLDSDGKLIEVNQTALEYVEGRGEKFVGEPFWETPWWPGLEEDMEDKVRSAAAGEYVEYEAEHVGEGVEDYVSRGVIYPVRDEDGDVDSLVVLAQDVTEERNRQRELERYERYVDSTTDIISHMDDSGRILYESPSVEDVLGYPQGGRVGETAFSFVHPEDRERVAKVYAEAMAAEEDVENVEYRMERADGSYVWLESVGRDVSDTDIEGVVVSSRDITERKEREQELERYQRYVDSTSDIITHLDEEGRIIYHNPAVERVLDIETDDWIGESVFDRIHPEDREEMIESFTSLAEGAGFEAVEHRIEIGDGSYVWLESVGRDVSDTELGGVVVSSRDISDRKRHERQLREREERLSLALHASEAGVWDWNLRTDEVVWDENLERMFGLEPGEFDGTLEAYESYVHPDDAEELWSELERSMETGERFDVEYRAVDENGEQLWIHGVGAPVTDDEDEVVRFIGIDLDVTERKERERELERYANLWMNLPVGVCRVKVKNRGEFLEVNERMVEILDAESEEDLLGRFIGDRWVDQEDRHEVLKRLDEEGWVTTESQFRTLKGRLIWARLTLMAFEVEEGEFVVDAVVQDITERREEEEQLGRAQEIARIGRWTKDIPSDVIQWSDEVYELWGVEGEGPLDHEDFLDHIHPEDREKVDRRWEAAKSGEPYDVEHRVVTDEGEVRWMREQAEVTFDSDGEPVRAVGVVQDITEQKQRERELRQARDEYRELIDGMNEAAFVIGPDHQFRYVNDAAVDALGYSRDELLSMKPQDIDASLEDSEIERLIQEMPEDEIQVFETVHESRDGEQIPVEISSSLISFRGDRAVLSVARDITERKEQQRELDRRLRAIEEAPVGIAITDPNQEDNPLVYVNRRFLELTGYSEDEVLGRNCRFLQGERTRDEPVQKMREAIDAEEPVEVELLNYRKDGSEFWNRVGITPVFDEAGELTNFVGYQQDVSERREREQHLRVVDRVLRHNLRNDLNLVQGYAEELEDQLMGDGESRSYTRGIVEVCDSLLKKADKERRIIELLTEAPGLQDENVSEVARRAVETVRRRHPDADITVSVPEDVRMRLSDMFEQALEELVENAVIHNDTDTPEVEVSVEETDGEVVIQVRDDGPDIPEMEVGVLTEEAEGPLYHGSGLGLWFVHWVVRRSNGRLSVEDNEPRGNVVTVTLESSADEGGWKG